MRRNLGAADDIMASPQWRQNIATGVGTSNTLQVGRLLRRHHHRAAQRRGRRARDHPRDADRSRRHAVAGHVFNVVNRNGRVFFLDGQTGKLARLENYSGGLEFLRTH